MLCFFLSMTFSYCIQPEPIKTCTPIEYSVGPAIDFIAKFEGLALTAYQDTNGKYSIGYGTRSFEGEAITKNEAFARFSAIVRQSMHKVQKDFPCATQNEMVALTSVYYNCGSGYNRIKSEGLHVHKPGFCELPGHSGLVKRREAERKLLFHD
ncbi:hypothetical protein KA050_04380 [Candidatus Gracilibacteria bacterium]|nr:hypothetical protein [Candidatus Gracilibacteria bacterium]